MFDYSDDSQRKAEETRQALAEKPARKIKVPKLLAVIDQSGCTGCEACVQFCPVDCIELVPGEKFPDMGKTVEVDLDRCIGCKLCAKYCPWDTIHMVGNDVAEEKANDWTLFSVIDPKFKERPIWPRPEPVEESESVAAVASESPAPQLAIVPSAVSTKTE
jgi:ferredoxin